MRGWGSFSRGLAASITSLCLLAQLIQVAPAAASEMPTPPRPVEILDKRTEFSRTWETGMAH
jgi:hypothetical protein